MTAPTLLVGIDTEGDNQWDLRARQEQTFENIYALPKLHALFQRHGVRPTYVVTWPVATDERSQQVLRYLLLRGDCEIGAHHHAWETPPCTPDDVRRHPYASTLPLAQFEAQLAELTAAIGRATGERPVSYRSGRFGFDASHVAALEREGYLVESSVVPLFYESHKGGPDFVEAPLRAVFPVVRLGGEARHQSRPRGAVFVDVASRHSGTAGLGVRARAVSVHDQARAAEARRGAGGLAATVLLLA